MLNQSPRMNVQVYEIEDLWRVIKELRPHAFGYVFHPRSATADGLPQFKYIGVPVNSTHPLDRTYGDPPPPLKRYVTIFPDRLCEPHQLVSGKFDRLAIDRTYVGGCDGLVLSYLCLLLDLTKAAVQAEINSWRQGDPAEETSTYRRVVRAIGTLAMTPTLVFDEPEAMLPEIQAHYARVNGVR